MTFRADGVQRMVFEFDGASHKAAEEVLKRKGLKPSPQQAWWLHLAWTDPDYQGKGDVLLCAFSM